MQVPIAEGLRLADDVLAVVRAAVAFQPDVLQLMQDRGDPARVATAVAILGGASLLAGESVVLFLNQVRRLRFFLSLLLNGVFFAFTLLVWSLSIWSVGVWGLGLDPPPRVVFALVGLGAAPFVFGFLILAPYFGPAVARVLYVWSLLLIVREVSYTFGVGLLAASACVGLGWVFVLLLGRTVGRPVVRLRNRLWERVAGPRRPGRAQDILAEALESADPRDRGSPS
jgi:hypothetical protein